MNLLERTSEHDLEAAVKALERVHFDGQDVDVVEHVPPRDHPCFLEIATELIRVDMELRFSGEQRCDTEAYRRQIPEVFADREARSAIAFEEFRLRKQAGEDVASADYARRFDIETSVWRNGGPTWVGPAGQVWDDVAELVDRAGTLPEVGDRIFGFELIEELGQGAFGKVFLARQEGLADRRVVVKVISAGSDEPTRLAELQHTHIVPIFSVHRDEAWQGICMPYFGRTTLGQVLLGQVLLGQVLLGQVLLGQVLGGDPSSQRAAVVPVGAARVQWALRIASDVAQGLAHAHERGIVHRDIKPANVLLADDGRAMLLDFNLSDRNVAGGSANLFVGGTLPYMPPEQLESIDRGNRVGFTADVFSLGAVLFEMLTLERPFAAPRQQDVGGALEQMMADRRQGPPPLRSGGAGIPPAVTAIVQKCLATDPDQRYPTAAELADDLAAQLNDRPLRHTPNPSGRERLAKWSRRHPRISSGGSVAAAVGTVAMLLAAMWWGSNQRSLTLEARQDLQAFLESSLETRMALTAVDLPDDVASSAVSRAVEELGRYQVGAPLWRSNDDYARLSPRQQHDLDERLFSLAYLSARNARARAVRTQGTPRTDMLRLASGLVDQALDVGGADRSAAEQLLREIGRLEEGRSQPGPIHQDGPFDFADAYLAASESLRGENWIAAETRLNRVLASRPNDEAAWLALGLAQVGRGELAAAEASLSMSVRLRPSTVIGHLRRGELRLEARNFAAARDDFEVVIRRRPELATPYAYRGMAHYGLDELELAIADISRAIELGSPETRLYFIRSRWRQQLGDHAGSVADREAGLRQTPVDENGWLARGMAQLKIDPQAAVADFQQALKLNPDSVDALRNIAYAYAEPLNDPQQAIELFDTILSSDPSHVPIRAARAVLSARVGERERAIRDLEIVTRADLDAKGLLQVASVYAILSTSEPAYGREAVTWLARAILQEPRIARFARVDPDLEPLSARNDFMAVVRAAAELKSVARGQVNPNDSVDGEPAPTPRTSHQPEVAP